MCVIAMLYNERVRLYTTHY